MKSFTLACLLGTIVTKSVAESPNCPESTQVFSYNEHVPAAAGFIQTDSSACRNAGVIGVNCLPNHQFVQKSNATATDKSIADMKGD